MAAVLLSSLPVVERDRNDGAMESTIGDGGVPRKAADTAGFFATRSIPAATAAPVVAASSVFFLCASPNATTFSSSSIRFKSEAVSSLSPEACSFSLGDSAPILVVKIRLCLLTKNLRFVNKSSFCVLPVNPHPRTRRMHAADNIMLARYMARGTIMAETRAHHNMWQRS